MWATLKNSMMNPFNRAVLFSAFGLACFGPIVALNFWHNPMETLEPDLGLFFYAILCYAAGMVLYISKIPERFTNSGKLDYLGSSHQIFHCLVLAGVFLTFQESIRTYRKRLEFQCPD